MRMYLMNWNTGQYWEILMLQYLIEPWVYWFCEPPEKSKLNLSNSIGCDVYVYRNLKCLGFYIASKCFTYTYEIKF